MEPPQNRSDRTLIDRGLDAYRRGDAKAALACWEQALAARPTDGQLRALVDYVRQQIADGAPAGGKVTFESGFEGDADQTNPELAHETLERVLRAERDAADDKEAAADRPSRRTLVSPLSEILAPATRKEWPDEQTDEVPAVDEKSRDKRR